MSGANFTISQTMLSESGHRFEAIYLPIDKRCNRRIACLHEALYGLQLHKSTRRIQQTRQAIMIDHQVCLMAHCRFGICYSLFEINGKSGAFYLWHARESTGALSLKWL